ncbi:hypothetical protein [Saccharopolyspora hattusasensis]|uniref:hypothetical protein n=1 Tax=Saccharopolyspora hattusasensis TaxID=1128679 RepID=UPI003D978986
MAEIVMWLFLLVCNVAMYAPTVIGLAEEFADLSPVHEQQQRGAARSAHRAVRARGDRARHPESARVHGTSPNGFPRRVRRDMPAAGTCPVPVPAAGHQSGRHRLRRRPA